MLLREPYNIRILYFTMAIDSENRGARADYTSEVLSSDTLQRRQFGMRGMLLAVGIGSLPFIGTGYAIRSHQHAQKIDRMQQRQRMEALSYIIQRPDVYRLIGANGDEDERALVTGLYPQVQLHSSHPGAIERLKHIPELRELFVSTSLSSHNFLPVQSLAQLRKIHIDKPSNVPSNAYPYVLEQLPDVQIQDYTRQKIYDRAIPNGKVMQ